MSEYVKPPSERPVHGTIRSRLLVNALVDPEEVGSRLPAGLRPHVTGAGTVVGVCLLDLAAVRPAGLPRWAGVRLRAAAHRISVDWEDDTGATVTGVYVPVRHTGSWLAIAAGGRWFPGVHERAQVDLSTTDAGLRWTSTPADDTSGLGIRVAVSVPADVGPEEACEVVGTTCLGADVGLSPGRDGALEGARMMPAHRAAQQVVVEDLESAFLDGFASAALGPAYLMREADVRWTTVAAPPARSVHSIHVRSDA